jgi:SH3-like domain-containing protein
VAARTGGAVDSVPSREGFVRTVFFVMAVLAAGAARAQTPAASGTTSAASSTHAKSGKTVTKPSTTRPVAGTTKPSAKTAHAKATPVVAPRHGAATRKPVHPKTPVAVPKGSATSAAKEAAIAKPVSKPAVPARPVIPADEGTVTHLHLPRYVSLRSDEVNMRAGPAARFPILWVYKRKELPVKIEREFDIWRLVEDMDGIKGWVHQATITGRRTFVIAGTESRTLRAEASDDSDAVAVLKPGVVGRIKSCDAGAVWCRVEFGGYSGFLARAWFWGTDPGEAVAP